jgi:hypothetical protein
VGTLPQGMKSVLSRFQALSPVRPQAAFLNVG